MKCRKCKQEMQFKADIEKVLKQMLPQEQQEKELEDRVVICEHCEQPYGYMKSFGKIKLFAIDDKWLAKQPEANKKKLQETVTMLKEGLKTMKLVKEWRRIICEV